MRSLFLKCVLLLLVALVGVQLVGCTPLVVNAPNESEAKITEIGLVSPEGLFYDVYDNGEVTVTGRRDGVKTLVIPDEINGRPVTAIGNEAFAGDGYLVYAELGKNVRKIGENAFYGCVELIRVDATEALKSIGYFAFYGCSLLSSVNGAVGLTEIYDSAFGACPALCYLELPETLTKIGDAAFYCAISLPALDLPDGDITIGAQAFYGCKSLCSVELGGLREIPDEAFYDCVLLNAIDLTDIKSVGRRAFYGCTSLLTVKEDTTLESVGISAFFDTPWLASQTDEFVIAGDGVLLKYNGSADSVKVPRSVKYVSDAFSGNNSIVKAEISGKTETIGEGAFSSCRALQDVVLSADIKLISSSAFSSCSRLRTIYLPKSLQEIGDSAFVGCLLLYHVKYGGSAEDFSKVSVSSENSHLIGATFSYGVSD